MGQIFIGTSGFSYKDWENGVFYPQGLTKNKQLEYYSQYFTTLELNNSFYHLPSVKNFQHWYQQTPQDFIFAVKASRYITHLKRLQNVQEPWQRFIQNAKELKEKLGPILFQFPASWPKNNQRLKTFLEILPKKYRYAFEFRHPSWFSQEIYQLLEKHKSALCIADSDNWPLVEKLTADFIYLRFHGRGRLYAGKYTDQQLKKWADKIKKYQKQIKQVYIYFNNDAKGYAVKNALTLKKLVEK